MENKEQFTENEIEHLKVHQELLEQRQGKDIMQNFFVINPKERQEAFRDAANHMKKKLQEDLIGLTSGKAAEIIHEDINIIDNFLGYFPNRSKSKSGYDIPKMVKLAEDHSKLLLEMLTKLIDAYKKDVKTVPKIQSYIDTAQHIFLDFSILLKIKHPTSVPYLWGLKKDLGIKK